MWQLILIIIDVALFVGFAVWGVFAILGASKKTKKTKK